MPYKIIISDDGCDNLETIVSDYDKLMELLLVLKDSSDYKLIKIEEEKDFVPCEDVIDILQKDVKPENLETGKRRKKKWLLGRMLEKN